jgi:UDP-2,3-diacylglucosamine pyrophosphatase LpxH
MDIIRKSVYKGLKETFKNSPEEEIEDFKKVKWIIFSDLHKGQGDGADDFKVCKPVYHAALGYYLAAGYTLILLGDVEELWESFPRKVFKEYQDTFELEKKFTNVNGQKRYLRIWGNHDDIWRWKSKIKKYGKKLMGESKELYEGKKFKITHKGKEIVIFLAHGHQGTLESDRFRWLSRFLVKVFWRNFQRITRKPSTTSAKDFKLRKEH